MRVLLRAAARQGARRPLVSQRRGAHRLTGHGDIVMAGHGVGAADFLEKPVRPDALLASIKHAFERTRDAAKLAAWDQTAAERLACLMPREREVMNRVVKGHPNKIIADDLGISQRAVENHRAAVMKRTGMATLPRPDPPGHGGAGRLAAAGLTLICRWDRSVAMIAVGNPATANRATAVPPHISTSAPSSMTRSGGMRKNSVGRVARRVRPT